MGIMCQFLLSQIRWLLPHWGQEHFWRRPFCALKSSLTPAAHCTGPGGPHEYKASEGNGRCEKAPNRCKMPPLCALKSGFKPAAHCTGPWHTEYQANKHNGRCEKEAPTRQHGAAFLSSQIVSVFHSTALHSTALHCTVQCRAVCCRTIGFCYPHCTHCPLWGSCDKAHGTLPGTPSPE